MSLFLFIGFIRGNTFVTHNLFHLQEEVLVTGIVRGFPEAKRGLRRYQIEMHKITGETVIFYPQNKKVYLYADYTRFFKDGTHLSVRATIKPIEAFLTNTGRNFYYDRFLETKGVVGAIYYPRSIRVLEDSLGQGLLSKIKGSFVNMINSIFSFPNAPLLSGVLLGVVDTLGDQRLDDFRVAGLIHIVVLSGSNIAIIIEAVRRSIPVQRHFSIILSALFITSFVFMVGLEASIVRASLMAFISLLAQASYSRYSVYRSLWITAFLMVMWSPGIILYDPSFILSMLATIGMVYINPGLEKKLIYIPERFEMRFVVASTCSTYFAVLPYLLYSIGSLSTVSLFVNLITLPLVPWIMLGGFIATIISFVSYTFASPLVLITELFLTYIQNIVSFFSGWNFSEVSISVDLKDMFGMYTFSILMGIFMYLKRRRPCATM